MKVLYAGNADVFAQTLINRLAKEDDEVYLVGKNNFSKQIKPSLHYKYFATDYSGGSIIKIFPAIHPDTVVFGGDELMLHNWADQVAANEYISQLNLLLALCSQTGCRFVLLSSTEVYGSTSTGEQNEDSTIVPTTLKGRTCAVAENMVKSYSSISNFPVTILRCGPLYNYYYLSQSGAFLDNLADTVLATTQLNVQENCYLQPISIGDVVDAIKRSLTKSRNLVLNICVSTPELLSDLYKETAKRIGAECQVTADPPNATTVVSSEVAKLELEWSDHKQLINQLENEALPRYKKSVKETVNKTGEKKKSNTILKVVENLVLFGVFLAVTVLSKDNSMFATVNWMMIYIIIVALFYGTMQSFLAIFLAATAYFVSQDMQITQLTNFYSYAGGIVKIIEWIFAGILVSYTTDMLREELRSKSAEKKLLNEEKLQLESINDENVRIKNEYEKRLLSSKTSLPKLYSIISRINVLQPDKIFSEVLNVVADIMETDTVSVYVVREKSSYLRLVTSKNERSAYDGKSWNLSEYPNIYKAIQQNELFVGNKLDKEPAFVAPIFSGGRCIAAILIMEMPFSGQSLYHANLLRTLVVLVSEALSKALDYEQRVRQTRYIAGTDVLLAEEFDAIMAHSEEKKEQGIANYCVIECSQPEGVATLEQLCESLNGLLRDTDILGDAGNNGLRILLPNNTAEEGNFVVERLLGRQLKARIL